MKKILMKNAKKYNLTVKEYILLCVIRYSINLMGMIIVSYMFGILIYNYLFGEIYM